LAAALVLAPLAVCTMRLRAARSREPIDHVRFEWVSVIAHDLRQPISVIALRSSALLRSTLSREQRDSVEQIARCGRSLSRMVSDLLDASLLESDRLRITLDRLDLDQLVSDIVRRTPAAAARTRVRTDDAPLFVRGDAMRLEQVIANLLSNAVKYSTPDTPIDVTMRVEGGQAHMRVANVGEGIPGDELPFIFNRFARGRSAAASQIKGLGLGLYIAKGLVAAHQGRIWADSTPDGTTFHVALPLDGRPLSPLQADRHAMSAPLEELP
jgi:signal transduction histidine kinase